MPSIKPIETRYAGYRFRSRLEARWAVFFDALGVKWEYEPEGFTLPSGECYLPDFYLPEFDFYAEVKPEGSPDSCFNKAKELCLTTGNPVLLLSGTPEFKPLDIFEFYDGKVGKTDCVLTTCLGEISWDVYWATGGGMTDRELHEMCETLHRAVDAARSARFEFGEIGA